MTKKERNKMYYEKNKNKILEKIKIYKKTNKEQVNALNREYKKRHKEEIKLKDKDYYVSIKDTKRKKYRADNKNKINKRACDRRKNDPLFKITTNLRTGITGLLREKGFCKRKRTLETLGCSYEEFKLYLELRWEPWMNWNNYGKYNGQLNFGWDVDHIVPTSSTETEEELYKLNHYTNLRPLCSYINRYVKRNNIN